MVGQKLVTVADTENGRAALEYGPVDIRAAGLVHTSGATGNNEALTRAKLAGRRVTQSNVSVHAQFANTPRDQMSVLTASIENGDLGFSECCSQNRRASP